MPDYRGPLGVSLRDIGVSADVLTGWADAAEAGGYSGIWMPDVGGHDALSTLAAFAATTRRVLLGTGVVPVFSRSPVLLAQTAATMDDLSGGRFVLGLGAGAKWPAEHWFGASWGDLFARLEATVAAVRAVAAGKEADVAWEGGDARGFKLGFPPARPHPPVVLAALNPRMLALAGRIADGVLLNWLPLDAAADAVAQVRQAATEAGRDPATVVVGCYVRACIGELAELADDLRPQVLTYLEYPAYAAMLRRAGIADVDRVAAAAPADRLRRPGGRAPRGLQAGRGRPAGALPAARRRPPGRPRHGHPHRPGPRPAPATAASLGGARLTATRTSPCPLNRTRRWSCASSRRSSTPTTSTPSTATTPTTTSTTTRRPPPAGSATVRSSCRCSPPSRTGEGPSTT